MTLTFYMKAAGFSKLFVGHMCSASSMTSTRPLGYLEPLLRSRGDQEAPSRRLAALFTSSCIAILPIGFYFLEPSSSASNLIAMRVYAIGTLLLLALVGCPSAIALYFSQSKRSFFFLFCASTVGATSAAILIGLACMGVAA